MNFQYFITCTFFIVIIISKYIRNFFSAKITLPRGIPNICSTIQANSTMSAFHKNAIRVLSKTDITQKITFTWIQRLWIGLSLLRYICNIQILLFISNNTSIHIKALTVHFRLKIFSFCTIINTETSITLIGTFFPFLLNSFFLESEKSWRKFWNKFGNIAKTNFFSYYFLCHLFIFFVFKWVIFIFANLIDGFKKKLTNLGNLSSTEKEQN